MINENVIRLLCILFNEYKEGEQEIFFLYKMNPMLIKNLLCEQYNVTVFVNN